MDYCVAKNMNNIKSIINLSQVTSSSKLDNINPKNCRKFTSTAICCEVFLNRKSSIILIFYSPNGKHSTNVHK